MKHNNSRTESIPIRFTPSEKNTIQRIADKQYEYPSSYLRRLILNHINAVAQTVGEHIAL